MDLRIADGEKVSRAFKRRLCWTCGHPLGRWTALAIGPMCVVNRITSEPASHVDCIEWAVKACPFLSRPAMRRSPRDKPEDVQEAPGFVIARNPGVVCEWVTDKPLRPFTAERGTLFRLPWQYPERIEFWAEGRAATLDEVAESIASGLPILRGAAEAQGKAAVDAFGGFLMEATAVVAKHFNTTRDALAPRLAAAA